MTDAPTTTPTALDAAQVEPVAKVERPADVPERKPVVSALDSLAAMRERWEKGPEPAFSTGLAQLNAVLGGGLRRKSFVLMTGAAKSGKTSLFDQVVFDAVSCALSAEDPARQAFGLVLSPEMTVDETIARWLARLAFLLRRNAKGSPERWAQPDAWTGYDRITTGDAWQAEGMRSAVEEATERARRTLSRLAVERLPPLSPVSAIEERIERACERWPGMTPIVFIDPIQRFAPTGCNPIEAMRMEETERVSHVAPQVFDLAERKGLIVLATADTTKAGAGGASSATAARGSYMLNHAATTVLGFHRTADPRDDDADAWEGRLRALAERLTREGGAAEGEDAEALTEWIAGRVPLALWDAPDARRLGRRAVYLECSGNRAGPSRPCAFGSVPGAALFEETEASGEDAYHPTARGGLAVRLCNDGEPKQKKAARR